jgi:hypothetical protein
MHIRAYIATQKSGAETLLLGTLHSQIANKIYQKNPKKNTWAAAMPRQRLFV